jgi:hypothetical protein
MAHTGIRVMRQFLASFLTCQSRRRRRSWRTYRPQGAIHHTAVLHGHGCVSFPSPQAAKFGYIRNGGSVLQLSPPYENPFAVVEAGPKFFTVDISGRRETISVDWLNRTHVHLLLLQLSLDIWGLSLGCTSISLQASAWVGSPVVTPMREERSSRIRETEWSKSESRVVLLSVCF